MFSLRQKRFIKQKTHPDFSGRVFLIIFPAVTYSPSFHQYHRRKKLNYRVRNGNGCILLTIPTGKKIMNYLTVTIETSCYTGKLLKKSQAFRLISTSQLSILLYLHLWPINLVVFKVSLFHKENDI